MSPLQNAPRDVDRRQPVPLVGPARVRAVEAMTFCVLRLIDARGGLTGIEVSNQVAPITRILGPDIACPVLPLLHQLEDRGLLAASDDRPPRYRISESGAEEAARLAVGFWPIVADRIARIDARVALLFARDGQPVAVGTAGRL